jgi:hypothetical protein
VALGAHKSCELLGKYWRTEKVPLRFVALMNLEKVKLILRFHTLSNNPEIEASTHVDNCPNNIRLTGNSSDLPHERLVDFEGIKGKLSKVTQTGVACAEVIDSHLYTHSPQGRQD